jgi:predicted transcriptional regulator
MYVVKFHAFRDAGNTQTRSFLKESTRDAFIKQLIERKATLLSVHRDENPHIEQIRQLLRTRDEITVAQVVDACNCTKNQAQRMLNSLAKAGEATRMVSRTEQNSHQHCFALRDPDADPVESRMARDAKRRAADIKPFRDPFIAVMYGDAS